MRCQTLDQEKEELRGGGVPIQGCLALASTVNKVVTEHQFLDPVQGARGTGEVLACAVCLA